MFTPESRESLRSELIEIGKADARLSGVAITGSVTVGNEDRWSDIDLAFGVREEFEVKSVLDDFSSRMYGSHGALHHLDVPSGKWIYRVFLLANTLQVDLAFAPATDFGARGPTFRLVSGEAVEERPVPPARPEDLIGWAWLYALHARSCIARDKPWQAEYMISAMRDQILALACLRLDLPAREGRGLDRLPKEITTNLEETLLGSLEKADLLRAFQALTASFLSEIDHVDKELAQRLTKTLQDLTNP